MKKIGFGLALCVLLLQGSGVTWAQEKTEPTPTTASPSTELISDKEAEIKALDEKIKTLRTSSATTAAEAELIAKQIERLKAQLDKAHLELNETTSALTDMKAEQSKTEAKVASLTTAQEERQKELYELVRRLYQSEQTSWLTMWMSSGSLSSMLAERSVYEELQQRTLATLQKLQTESEELKQHQAALNEQQQQLHSAQVILAAQQAEVAEQKAEQNSFLQRKRTEQASYEQSLRAAEAARAEIEAHVFTLKSAKVSVSLNSANDMARYASKLTGVRPALLLAVLKTESGVGSNIGSGTYLEDMPPSQREAFVRITKTLSLDPATTPISRGTSYGWGGAMGPGQFMPTTWEGIEGRLTTLVGHTPNPYDLADAFVATALFLADRGATKPEGEYEAVNRYIAGPNWQRFSWYGDRVLAVAKEYEKELS